MKKNIENLKLMTTIVIIIPILFAIIWCVVLYLDKTFSTITTQIALIIDIIASTIIGVVIYKKGESSKVTRFEYEMNNIHNEIKYMQAIFDEYSNFIKIVMRTYPADTFIEQNIKKSNDLRCNFLKIIPVSNTKILEITKYSRDVLHPQDVRELELLSSATTQIINNLPETTNKKNLKNVWTKFEEKNKSKINDVISDIVKIRNRIRDEYKLDGYESSEFI